MATARRSKHGMSTSQASHATGTQAASAPLKALMGVRAADPMTMSWAGLLFCCSAKIAANASKTVHELKQ
jgi:hypothetical protein